ncbi:MAG: family 43 glycosylhydrolase [Oscillospiraceae bacterium]
MKHYYCNPLNVDYLYQFNQQGMGQQMGPVQISREAADPSMIYFKGKYYIFASMTLGVWVSEDLAHWENKRLPDNLPFYDYAPDVRVIGDYVYFCASKREEICNFYRTKNIEEGPYEEIKGSFDFWDPHQFVDDDGRVYFYWGCANMTPIWGVEMDPETMHPKTERVELIHGNWNEVGYERNGEDHCDPPLSDEALEVAYEKFLEAQGGQEMVANIPENLKIMMKGFLSNRPYIEGAWMNKHDGKYYLQYACPGTQYNIYADGVYVSDKPLGPYKLAKNNPFSYKPGGFIPGAGHGSTMEDATGSLWHTATMRISVNHNFERRVGLWPAGFDKDGELFCNQRYGDWPMAIEDFQADPWKNPQWMLLSCGKTMTASSAEEGKGAEKAAEENVQTWWRAASAQPGEWLQMDLGKAMDVRAIQINFADDKIDIEPPKPLVGNMTGKRYIEERNLITRWKLEGSLDGDNYFMIEDKSDAKTDLPHDMVVREDGIQVRYLKLTVLAVPYDQPAAISGLRVFGIGDGEKPAVPTFTAERLDDLDMKVAITSDDADVTGYNILWGHAEDKLYHSYMIFGKKEQKIGALIKGTDYFVRVDAFNENGITEGEVIAL